MYVGSMSEQMAKIINAGSVEEDYVGEWYNSWTVDHFAEAKGSFNVSATSVYFNEADSEIIFTQLFAEVRPITQNE